MGDHKVFTLSLNYGLSLAVQLDQAFDKTIEDLSAGIWDHLHDLL